MDTVLKKVNRIKYKKIMIDKRKLVQNSSGEML